MACVCCTTVSNINALQCAGHRLLLMVYDQLVNSQYFALWGQFCVDALVTDMTTNMSRDSTSYA